MVASIDRGPLPVIIILAAQPRSPLIPRAMQKWWYSCKGPRMPTISVHSCVFACLAAATLAIGGVGWTTAAARPIEGMIELKLPGQKLEGMPLGWNEAGSSSVGSRRSALGVRSRGGERLQADVGPLPGAIRLPSFEPRCCESWAADTRSAGRATTWSSIPATSATNGPSGSKTCIARSCTISRSAASSRAPPCSRYWAWCAQSGEFDRLSAEEGDAGQRRAGVL